MKSALLGDTDHIEVRGLRRVYGTGEGTFEAVRGIDLVVGAGTIVALLGTNGAGKTSALEVVEGRARPTAGQVRVLGLDPVTPAVTGSNRLSTGVCEECARKFSRSLTSPTAAFSANGASMG